MAQSIYKILVQLENDKEVKKGLEQIGTASGLAGAALLAFTNQAATAAREYNDSLANLATVSDESTGSTEELNLAFGELSDELDGAVSKAEAATAAYDVLSAGYKDQTDLLFILEQSQKAAIGGLSDLGTVSDATTSILNAYGDALGENLSIQERTTLVLDTLIKTQFDGKTTVDALASSIGRLTPVAAANNVSLQELGGSLAVITAGGVETSQAVTGLQAGITNILKPTKEAADEAARLGIEFNQSALQAKGLEQFLLDIVQSEQFTSQSLARLFSSTEGLNAITALTAENGEKLVAAIQSQAENAGTLEEAYGAKATTDLQIFNNTLNQLNNALVDLGQGSIIALAPFVDLLSKAVGAFNQLSPEVKQFIGVATGISGAVLVANGAILLLAAQVGSLATNLKAASVFITTNFIPALGKLVASAKSGSLTLATFNTTLKSTLVTMGPFVAGLAAIAGAAVLLQRDIRNANIELENLELRGLQVETQALADKATQLGFRIQQTGEAIPEEEFNRYIRVLEDANKENVTLTQIIDALKKKQEEALGSTQEFTQATDESAEAVKETAGEVKSAEEIYKEYEQTVRASLNTVAQQRQLNLQNLQNNTNSEEALIKGSLAIEKKATQEKLALLDGLKNAEGATAEQRADIEIEQAALIANTITQEQEALKRRAELQRQSALDIAETKRILLDAEIGSDADNNDLARVEALAREEFELKKSFIVQELKEVEKGTAEEARLQKELATLQKDINNELQALDQQRLDNRLEQIEQATNAEVASFETIQRQTQASEDLLQSQAGSLDEIVGLTDRLGGLLEDENLSRQQRNELLRISEQIFGDEFDSAQALESIEAIRAKQELAKLELKEAQLKIDQEQLKIANEIKQAELQGENLALQAQLGDPSLNQGQRSNIQRQIEANQQISALSNQSTLNALDANQLSIDVNEFAQAIEQAISGVGSSEGAFGNLGSDRGSTSGDRVLEGLKEEVSRGSKDQQELLGLSNENLRSLTVKTDEVGGQTVSNLVSLSNGVQSLITTTNQIAASLNNIEFAVSTISSKIDNLPGRIASRIPRSA